MKDWRILFVHGGATRRKSSPMGRILEMDNRVRRVVLLGDGETVHNAFFDRTFRKSVK